tara:strand:+ start:1428 stop:2483 length:1056 start_codon:yes stop_codon:yes gene_type:complete
MIYSIFPSKDTTLYEASESVNTGLDSILEITKVVSESNAPGLSNTRIALGFDITPISKSINSGSVTMQDAYLNLYISKAEAIPYNYTLCAKNVLQSWDMGIGKLSHNPETMTGASWVFTDESGSTKWTVAGGTTGSIITSQSFTYESGDARINVSESFGGFLSSSDSDVAGSRGWLIMRSGSEEVNNKRYGSLKFFSVDTHTIYPPKLDVCWDDSSWETGSLTKLSSSEALVYIKNNKFEYKSSTRTRFEVRGRDIFPVQSYGTESAALTSYYLPSSSYYSIKDANSEDTVIPFDDNYTKLSCTSNGNYFDLFMDGLQAERTYRIVIKVEDRTYTGQVEYFDNNNLFKVTR